MTILSNESDLVQWQLGIQSVFGTAVAGTHKLMGISKDSTLKALYEASAVEEARGRLDPAFDATVDKTGGEGSIKGDANAEEIGYFMDSFFGKATPTGAGPYVRTYLGAGTKPDPRLLTMLRGHTEHVGRLTGGIVKELSLKAESNSRTQFEANLMGYGYDTGGALASLSDNAVNYFHGNQLQIYIDAPGGTFGTTAVVPTVFNLELGLSDNKEPKHGLRSAAPTDWRQSAAKVDSNQLKLAMEVTGDSKAYLTSLLAGTGQSPWKPLIRLKWTIDANRHLTIDYAGWCAEAPEDSGDADGVTQFEFVFSPIYNSTLTSWIKVVLSNQVALLTS